MRDQGLQEAIRAAGGISALARQLGVAQPSISGWTRVPAERIAAVEAATGVAREVLRPDLFVEGAPTEAAPNTDPIDQARAGLYVLLGSLIMRMPEERALIDMRGLSGDDTALGEAVRTGRMTQANMLPSRWRSRRAWASSRTRRLARSSRCGSSRSATSPRSRHGFGLT
jgi:hypothetical protein